MLAVEGAAEPLPEGLTIGFAERHRRSHVGVRTPELVVDELSKDLGHLLQIAGAASLGHEAEEVAREIRDAEAPGNFEGNRPLCGRRHPRLREEGSHLGVVLEELRDSGELTTDDVDLAPLASERVERTYVGHRRGRASLHL